MILTYHEQLPPAPPQVALSRIAELLQDRGFRPVGTAAPGTAGPGLSLVLGRGSLWWNFLRFRMELLRQTLQVTVTEEADRASLHLVLRYDVNTIGQLITETDRTFFKEEAAALVGELKGTTDGGRRMRRYRLHSTLQTAVVLVIAALIGMLIGLGLVQLRRTGSSPLHLPDSCQIQGASARSVFAPPPPS